MSVILPIRDVHIGRLGLPTVTFPLTEQLGSEVSSVGEGTAVGQRKAKGFTLTFPIHATPGDSDLYEVGQRMRRQVRSILQNYPLRLAGLYFNFGLDPDRNGWIVFGEGELADDNNGVPFADYTLTVSQAFIAGQRHTHREAFRVDLIDLRLTTSSVDYLGAIINTTGAFASMSSLSLLALPVGASDASVLASPVKAGQRTTMDGALSLLANRVNGDVVSWERTEENFNKGDVVAYDRRGSTLIPTSG